MDMFNELTGNVAYIEIKNYKNLSWDNLKKKSQDPSLSALAGSVIAEAKNQLSGFYGLKNTDTADRIEPQGIKDGVIKVQYNPTSLKFSGSTRKNTDTKLVEAQRQKITTISAWGVLTMSVDLVFASTSIADTSVSDQMTAFLKMMQKSPEKEVIFSWADMVIEGKVTYFSGEYQMFYPSGLPKAGKISLKIEAESEPKKIETRIEKMAEEKSEKLAETGNT
jgi:hypothetical protein